jgi:hypothetical protein
MDHFAGLDVSVKETSVCIVDDTGRIDRQQNVAACWSAHKERPPRAAVSPKFDQVF